jgi:nitrite reductase/ring-hydroxylating ferredoxin subunit
MDRNLSEWRMQAYALAPGQSAKFSLRCGSKAVEGFVVNHGGRFYAYVNRCAHVGTPLDLWPNEFFTTDGRHLVCATHGAVYQPESGLCIAGPCPGAALTPLVVALEGAEVVVACAERAE